MSFASRTSALHASLRCSPVCSLRLAVLCTAAALFCSAEAKELSFDDVFNAKGEPSSLHYQAALLTRGKEGTLEVWRDGERRIKRLTGQESEVFAFKQNGDSEFTLSVLDKKRRIHTQIDRTNLYRIGNFTDWFDLSHGLRRPKGAYVIRGGTPPPGAPKPLAKCKWYDLTQDQLTAHVCWSNEFRVPVLIADRDGNTVWQLKSIDTKPISASTFVIHDEGYVTNDANQDIERD